MDIESRLIERYFRKVQAHPQGTVVHHGDCDFFSVRICTCGLHHDLAPLRVDLVDRHYPDFWKERESADEALNALRNRPKKKK